MPDFTVVIPARNEAAYLPLTLRALERQTQPPAEVIVVDNASRDDTAQLARAWGAQVISCAVRGIAHARQAGLDAARTPWVASTDADSLPTPEWLARLSEAADAAPGRVALYGPMRFCGVSQPVSALSELGYGAFLRVCELTGRPNLAGANMAFSRAAAGLVGGYPHVEAYEDVLLGRALAGLGEVAYVPGALVETSARRLEGGWLPFLWRHALNLSGHRRGYFAD
ncbi:MULTISPECIES: glycosyltransferase [Deinococcus]|uniref:Glycosyl transferase, family 2 n=1 Tax=Deinococcus geothermalis (strain DSM 11300 / CIP 105573 / AG-3a) TaxID=319795 RepID=Q1J0X2_DEIGD|nr:glycosyltransferase family 2 protein [Deinococcus geothermalis]ABF44862.1 glycosyl transferase, family 2 [Deinococcus geothermalis DSM 11300]MBI0447126.1 glycosyltransferase [Deinococcus sp. DB0503]